MRLTAVVDCYSYMRQANGPLQLRCTFGKFISNNCKQNQRTADDCFTVVMYVSYLLVAQQFQFELCYECEYKVTATRRYPVFVRGNRSDQHNKADMVSITKRYDMATLHYTTPVLVFMLE